MIGADTFSTIVDPNDRSTAVIFGDGAGAFVLRAGEPEEPGAIGGFNLGSDGEQSNLAAVAAGGSRQKSSDSARDHFLVMAGQAMCRNAVRHMTESSLQALQHAGWQVADVDRVVSYQESLRIIQAVAARLAVPKDRLVSNIEGVGNTVAASIPLAIADAVGAVGTIQPGHRVLLTGFGGGLTWGSTTLTWPQITLPADYRR